MPLSIRKVGPRSDKPEYTIYDGDRAIGRIHKDRHAAPELRWYWSLTVLGAGHAGIPNSGCVPTLEEAKAGLQTNFKKWLVWSKLEEADP